MFNGRRAGGSRQNMLHLGNERMNLSVTPGESLRVNAWFGDADNAR